MNLHDVRGTKYGRRKKVRVGRGESSGAGKQSGRGNKGQFSRSGASMPEWFEGGQMPFYRRIPKRGFTNAPFKTEYAIVNLAALAKHFKAGETVDPEGLKARGIVKKPMDGVKVLGDGTLNVKLTVKAHAFSKSAAEKIAAAGGTVEILKP